MESYKIENLSFAYPNRESKALDNICLTIEQGEFVTLCGKSGCGKTTLLRLLKPALAPCGELHGSIYFGGRSLCTLDAREQACEIGFVLQNPDSGIVTDKVWHELAFGAESLGLSTPEIRARVSEMASFFGIQTWFHKNVTELSGGQKQLLSLASVMVMQPSVLILDEPTSQLDPIAAQEFLNTLKKLNRELGTTVILTEHRLEDAFPMSDRAVVMDGGKIIANAAPEEVCQILKTLKHDMYSALPAPMRIYGAVDGGSDCPLTVREGRAWLEKYSEQNTLRPELIPEPKPRKQTAAAAVEVKDAWFRYEKNLPDVIKGLNVKIGKGELFAVVGGNGAGKTTALSLIAGLSTPYRGEVLINGESISRIHDLYRGVLGVLPQNPQTLFVKKTVYLDMLQSLSETKASNEEKQRRIKEISSLCRIDGLLECHPYDLSGGEQQRAALAKVLLHSPQILLLDEPTKGMDAHFKEIFADILHCLTENGVTVIMVSHDIEFCAEHADRCALVFDGSIVSSGEPREFFAGKSFYTTSANRMARAKLPKAVLAEDIILACGGVPPEKEHITPPDIVFAANTDIRNKTKKTDKKRLTPKRIAAGCIFALLFAVSCILSITSDAYRQSLILQLISVLELACCAACFSTASKSDTVFVNRPRRKEKLSKRTLTAAMLILIAVPLTIFTGVYYLQDRKYYFISLLIILETIIPFCMIFESRKPQARELIIISVLCAFAVAGRSAFYMLPQFKPVAAVVIISGVCFGGETGFLVGAVTGFVSNFFFGQGPWTPWQMFAFGIIGFLAGVLFRKGLLPKTKVSLCIFGGLAVLIIYGGIMNPAAVIMGQQNPTVQMLAAAYLSGLPFDLVHAVSTVFFLWFISEPMTEKIERVKIKYGLIDTNAAGNE